MSILDNNNKHLATKNRYYVAGWCDGKNSAKIVERTKSEEYQDYLSGYADAKENNEYIMSTFGE